jgi:hypothetical protein
MHRCGAWWQRERWRPAAAAARTPTANSKRRATTRSFVDAVCKPVPRDVALLQWDRSSFDTQRTPPCCSVARCASAVWPHPAVLLATIVHVCPLLSAERRRHAHHDGPRTRVWAALASYRRALQRLTLAYSDLTRFHIGVAAVARVHSRPGGRCLTRMACSFSRHHVPLPEPLPAHILDRCRALALHRWPEYVASP